MTPTEITSLVMAVAAISGAVYQLFTTRRNTNRMTQGSEATSWAELVEHQQAAMDRMQADHDRTLKQMHEECQTQIEKLREDVGAAERRIRDLQRQLTDELIYRREQKVLRDLDKPRP